MQGNVVSSKAIRYEAVAKRISRVLLVPILRVVHIIYVVLSCRAIRRLLCIIIVLGDDSVIDSHISPPLLLL